TAAAALMASSPGTAEAAIPILERAKERANDETRTAIDLALAWAYLSAHRDPDLVRVMKTLLAAHSRSDAAFDMLMGALGRLQKGDEARRVIQERLARDPDDVAGLTSSAVLEGTSGAFAKSRAAAEKLIALRKAAPVVYNNLAWDALFDEKGDL